jgi:hypothetical protein
VVAYWRAKVLDDVLEYQTDSKLIIIVFSGFQSIQVFSIINRQFVRCPKEEFKEKWNLEPD